MPARIELNESKIVEMYQSGLTAQQIAKKFNVSKKLILRRLNENNIERRAGKIKLDENKIIELYQKGLSSHKIAKIINASQPIILSRLKENNIKLQTNKISVDENKIISLYNSGKTTGQISKILNISKDIVRNRLKTNNISLINGRQKLKTDNTKIINLYEDGYSIEKINVVLNIGLGTIRNRLLENNIKMKPQGDYRRIEVNDNFFSTYTPESCYWAGFIAADGSVYENELSIQLKYIDYRHLQKFQKIIELKGTEPKCRENGKRPSISLKFRSNQITEDLKNNFSIAPSKTLILQPPGINNFELLRYFIRGYFDGDGCITWNKTNEVVCAEFYSGSRDFLEWVLKVLKQIVPTTATVKDKKSKKPNKTKRISCSGNISFGIVKWLYEESKYELRLNRKYERYTNYKNRLKVKEIIEKS